MLGVVIAISTLTHSHVTTAGSLAVGDTSVDDMLDISLQSPSKVLEHGRSSGKYDVLVKNTTCELQPQVIRTLAHVS